MKQEKQVKQQLLVHYTVAAYPNVRPRENNRRMLQKCFMVSLKACDPGKSEHLEHETLDATLAAVRKFQSHTESALKT